MKIVFFTENNHCGGLDTFLISLINNWPYSEDALYLICNASHPGLAVIKKKLHRACVIVPHHLPLLWQVKLNKFLKVGLTFFWFLYLIYQIKKIFKLDTFDRLMVVNGGYPAGDSCRAATIAWGKISPTKSVHNFHNFASKKKWFLYLFESWIDWQVARKSKKFISVSAHCAQSILIRKAIKKKNVRFIYNGVDEKALQQTPKDNIRQELNLDEDAPLCLMAAVYEPRKGHAFLFNAWDKVTEKKANAQLIVCGYGTQDEYAHVEALRKKSASAHQIHLLTFRDDIFDLMRQADVVVVPSQHHESFGLVAVESMVARTPVVVTRVGGLPEVVQHNSSGFCVDRDDTETFANTIIQLINNKELRREIIENAYARYLEKFTIAQMAYAYAREIRES